MALISNRSLDGIDKAIRAFDLLEKSIKSTSVAGKKLVKNLDLTTAKGHKALNEELKTAALREKELIKIENEKVKLLKTEEQLLQQKQRTQIQVTKEQERQIKIAKRLKDAANKTTGAFARERKELVRLEKEFRDLITTEGRATKKTEILRKRVLKLRGSIDRTNTSIKRFNDNVGNYSSALTGSLGAVGQFATGAGAIAGAVLIAGSAIRSAVNIIKDFEQAGANLAATLGDLATEDNINKLAEDAKNLGASTAFSATEVRSLQTEFAKLGFNPDAIINATEATLNLAAATGSDLAEAAAIAGATLGGFGLAANETQRITDLMAKSFSISALDIEKFRESMKTAAPAARAVGISVEETTALLGTLAKAGISGSKAGTSLATAFINLNQKGLNLEKGLEKVIASNDKLGTAVNLVGKEAAKAFLVLAEGTKITEGYEKSLIGAAGAAKRMADIQLDTLEGSIKILNSSWEGLILSMEDGSGVMSDISKNVIRDLSKALGIISGESKEAKKQFSFLGTILTVLKTNFNILIGVVKIFLTPLRLMIDGIVFLGEAIVKAARRFEFINKILGGTGGLFTLLTKILNNLPEIVDRVVDRVIKSLTKLVKFDFKGAFSEVTTGISDDIKELLADVEEIEKSAAEKSAAAAEAEADAAEAADAAEKSAAKKAAAEKVLTGLLNQQREAIRKLQEQRDKSDDAGEIAFLNERIKARQKELKLLTDSLIKIEKIQKREAEIAEDGIKIQKAKGKTTEQFLKEEADAEKKRRKAEQDKINKQKEQIRELAKAFDKGIEAQRKAHQERLSQFDEEIAASKKLQDSLAEDARRGVADAEDNLVFARQKEREATLERIQEVERQKRVEEGLVFLKLLASNAGNPNVEKPVITSIAQFTAARLFISSLASFYEGTENVGKSMDKTLNTGKDDYVIRVDKDERIVDGINNAKMSGISNNELGFISEQYKLGKLQEVNKKHKELHIAHSFMSNDKVIDKMDELIESNNNAYKKIKQTNWSVDALGRLVKEYQDERGRKNIDTYEKGGLFG